jgi:hypothetical protein
MTGTSSCFHVTQVEEIKRVVGEALYEREIIGPDGSPASSGGAKWWGTEVRPVDARGRPVPDTTIARAGVQPGAAP